MSFFKRMIIWIRVICSLIATMGGVKSHILTPQETVEEIKKGKSLIRFGDGEFGIYKGKDIHYQKWSKELKSEFDKIKNDFEIEYKDCPYILAVPKKFMTVNGFKLMKKRLYVACWAQSRYQFKKTFNRKLTYGDSFLFEKTNFEIYSKIWKDENSSNNVIFVHNNKDYANVFAKTYNKKVFFVGCPSKNAFDKIDDIEKEILSIIEKNDLKIETVSMAISAGPAGKVLVYRLSKKGFHCIDAGHCWDDPLEGI